MPKRFTTYLRNRIPPQKVALLGSDVSEVSTSGYQRIYADGKPYLFAPKQDKELREARKDVKKDGLAWIQVNGEIPLFRPKYFYFAPQLYHKFGQNNWLQVDINGAYWNIAKNKGYISEKTYKSHHLNKVARNMALGTWAVTTTKTRYKDGEIVSSDFGYKKTRPLFFDLGLECGKIMEYATEPFRGLPFFFWVDAIFCPEFMKDDVLCRVDEMGYQCSIDRVDAIISDGKTLYLYMQTGKKTFCLPPIQK